MRAVPAILAMASGGRPFFVLFHAEAAASLAQENGSNLFGFFAPRAF